MSDNKIGWKEVIEIAMAIQGNRPLFISEISDILKKIEEPLKKELKFSSKNITNEEAMHIKLEGAKFGKWPGLIAKGRAKRLETGKYVLEQGTYEELQKKYRDFIRQYGFEKQTNNTETQNRAQEKDKASGKSKQIIYKEQPSYLEKDMHPLLACFVYNYRHFQKALCMTVRHNEQKNSSKKELWTYPDMVGIKMSSYKTDIYNFVKDRFHINRYTLFSFELKKDLDLSNVREYYMQAVANSSWANEGYLVATIRPEKINEEDARTELQLLHSTYGIGVIRLFMPKNKDEAPSTIKEFVRQSEILHLARSRVDIGMGVISKLYELAPLQKFVKAVSSVTVGEDLGSNSELTKEKNELSSDDKLRKYFENMFEEK